MIVDLPDTTTNELNKKITALREEGGAITLGRVADAGDRPGQPKLCSRTPSRPPTRPAVSTHAASSSW